MNRPAAREGFFAEQGIEAVLQPQPSGKAALAAVLADEAELAQPAETPLVLATFDKEAVVLADFSGMGLPLAAEVWGDYDFGLRLEQSLMLSLEDQTLWGIGKRLTSAAVIPDFLEYIWVDGLLAVKPEAMRLIR